jgi:asparagine synthase (glutamine-hydrolysing)
MCGLAGIVNFDGEPVDRRRVVRMTEALEHRGPDGSGIWIDGHVGLGHRRLAIRDLSQGGAQPMIDAATKLVVVYNGELYNDLSLRRVLNSSADTRFRTCCDTEVIAPSYRLWGRDAFLKFEGMYAIALWDQENECLILARDPVGIKPLYFSFVGRSLRFASEIKALLVLEDQPRQLSPESLHRFFAQGYPGPARSLVGGIVPLPPGSTLVADRNGWRVADFWQPKRHKKVAGLEQALNDFERLWTQVVDDQLISDVPLALLLSGGIDSALIATALPDRADLSAYTATFGESAFDESGLATITAKQANLRQKFVSIDTETDIEARFRDVVAKVDGQLADSSALAFYSLCQKAGKEVRVLLTGDGADEFFAGYQTYRATRVATGVAPFLPKPAMRFLSAILFAKAAGSQAKIGTAEKFARLLSGMANGGNRPHPQWRRYLFPEQIEGLYGTGMKDVNRRVDALDEYAAALGTEGSAMDRALVADQRYYLPGDMLMKTDSMSMAHGVEVRVPFLDRRIMEFANGLDATLISPFCGPDKRLLRTYLETRGLPVSLTRGRKKGFNIPVASYLRHGLRPLGEKLLDREADCLAPFLRPDAVRRLWRSHIDGNSRSSYTLWTFLTLATWRTMAGI